MGNELGRPATARAELVQLGDELWERLSEAETVVELCDDLGVSTQTFYRYVNSSDELQERFREARTIGGHLLAEESVNLLDRAVEDRQQSAAIASLHRARAENRKWLASKVAPDTYGDRIKVEQEFELGSELAKILEKTNRESAEVDRVGEARYGRSATGAINWPDDVNAWREIRQELGFDSPDGTALDRNEGIADRLRRMDVQEAEYTIESTGEETEDE